MANYVIEQRRIEVNLNSTSIARLGMILGAKAGLTEDDFLPYDSNQFPHLIASTAKILQQLIKNKILPERILFAAQQTLDNK